MENWTKRILGIALGNTLVLYDFMLYGFLGSTLSQLFFPKQTPFEAMMSVFLVYASACLVRPVGAFMFGLIGDKYGRKTSLVTSTLMISSSSVLIGCLPTYHSVGELAVVLLVLLRIFQGLSISGEEVGSAVYLVESAPKHRKSLAGSISLSCVHIGLLTCAGFIWLSFNLLTKQSFMMWGWRIPFLASLPISFAALYFRLKQTDSNDFNKLQHNKQFAYPLKEIIKRYKFKLLLGFLLCSLSSVVIYIYAIYTPNYLRVYQHFSLNKSLIFNMISFFISTVGMLLVGFWGDKVGGPLVPIRWGSLAFIILSPFAFSLSASHQLSHMICAQALFIIMVVLSTGSSIAVLNALFPTEIRFTGIAICFNFSMIIFGSTAPMIILALHKATHYSMLPAVYLILMGVIGLLVVHAIKKQKVLV